MNTKYATQLIEAVERKFLKARVQHDLDAVQAEILAEAARVKTLKETLSKEQADVQELERMSLTNLVQTILGNKAEKLEKEQAEQVTAEIKYTTAVHLLDIMHSEKQGLLQQLETMQDVEHKIEKLLAIKSIGGDSEWVALAEKVAESHDRLIEIDEALEAGDAAENGFYLAAGFLNDARKIGIFDLIGGGFISSIAKHSSLDEAQKYAETAQINLQKFNRELHDVEQTSVTITPLSDLVRVADIFLDGLFVDLYAQDRITESLTKIETAEKAIKQKIEILKDLRVREMAEAQELEQRWQTLNKSQ